MATLRKRGSRWEAQVRKQGWPTQSQTFPSKPEAVSWANAIEATMAIGTFVDQRLSKDITLTDLLRRYVQEITPEKKSHATERSRIQAMLRTPFAETKLLDLSSQRISQWRDLRLKEVTGSSVNRELNLLSHVFNVARKEWGVPIQNPVASIRRPKENKARQRRLNETEETKLLAELEPTDRDQLGRYTGIQNPWIKPLVILAIETAMRRGELLSMTWDNVFLSERYVTLLDTKNGEDRDVPLSKRAFQTLSALPREPTRYVFPISEESVKKAFSRAVQRAGIKNLRFHDLRHEATTRISEKLDNVLELSAVTGHKTLSMLKRYYHPRASKLAEKLD